MPVLPDGVEAPLIFGVDRGAFGRDMRGSGEWG